MANSNEKLESVNNGTKCIMGTAMHTQQNMTAKLIHKTTSFSEIGKVLGSGSTLVLALSLHGDSLISRAIGNAIAAYINAKLI